MIETNALGPSARGSGRRSNFSISGKLMSTCGWPVARRARISSGRRCSVCGPNTRSTYGARLTIASPSCEATQPPTPITHRAAVLLERLPAAELAEDLFLRLLADRAGVDQDDVGFGSTLSVSSRPSLGGEHVGHLGRVVLVHLATVGLDEELAGAGWRRRGGDGGSRGRSSARSGRAAVNPRRRVAPFYRRGSCRSAGSDGQPLAAIASAHCECRREARLGIGGDCAVQGRCRGVCDRVPAGVVAGVAAAPAALRRRAGEPLTAGSGAVARRPARAAAPAAADAAPRRRQRGRSMPAAGSAARRRCRRLPRRRAAGAPHTAAPAPPRRACRAQVYSLHQGRRAPLHAAAARGAAGAIGRSARSATASWRPATPAARSRASTSARPPQHRGLSAARSPRPRAISASTRRSCAPSSMPNRPTTRTRCRASARRA